MLDLIDVGELKFDLSRFEGFPAKFIQHRGQATGDVVFIECETGSTSLRITISLNRQNNRFQMYSFSASIDTTGIILTSSTRTLHGL